MPITTQSTLRCRFTLTQSLARPEEIGPIYSLGDDTLDARQCQPVVSQADVSCVSNKLQAWVEAIKEFLESSAAPEAAVF